MPNPNFAILPNIDSWHDMQINPETVVSRFDDESAKQRVNRFKPSDLVVFFESNTQRSAANLSKEDLVNLIFRRHKNLKNTLIVIAQYSRFISKKVIEEYCISVDAEPEGRTTLQLALLLFNTSPDLLRRVRIASIGYNIQNTYAYDFDVNLVESELSEDNTIHIISELVESNLSTSDKRAKLVEYYPDDTKETYRLFVKYEDREQRVEEWDGSQWVKPVDWIVADYNPSDGFLNLRCRNRNRAYSMVSIISLGLTGREDAFDELSIESWSDKLETHETSESEDFKVIQYEIRKMRIENASLANRPTIAMYGSNLQEVLQELEASHNLDLLSEAAITSFDIKLTFEFEGVVDETTIRLNKETSKLNFKKDTNEQAKRYLINYLKELLQG
jgi:hypothetical protein